VWGGDRLLGWWVLLSLSRIEVRETVVDFTLNLGLIGSYATSGERRNAKRETHGDSGRVQINASLNFVYRFGYCCLRNCFRYR
jgi:hypothetical protein